MFKGDVPVIDAVVHGLLTTPHLGWTESDISQEGRAKLALHREARSPSVLLGPSIPIGGAP
jgi:hypothetical protein